jgi:ribosomal protein S18 acetylase RimI-like enzyme
MHFREATEDDVEAIYELYKRVAAREGGIARLESEVTREYIQSFVSKAVKSGLIIVCVNPDNPNDLIGEIHGSKNGLAVFNHVLSDVTIVVHPDHQGKKIGRTMLTIFLSEIAQNRPDIGKVELITRETNARAITLYQSLGFRVEGRMEMRIRTTSGNYEADIPMGWQNPNYEL